jgi:glycerophosphoryl diester phosphodiesterase
MAPGALENARSSMAIAAAVGADLLEMDIRLSLDRTPMVLHDAMLRRTTRARGWVRLWPAFALRRIPLRDAPDREPIATLAQVLDELPDGVQPALHLKDTAAIKPVLKLIERRGIQGRTWLWLERARDVYMATRALPELRVTLLRDTGWMPANRDRYFREAQWNGAAGVSIQPDAVDRNLILHAHQHHLRVFSVANQEQVVARLIDAGIDGIITIDPAQVQRLSEQRP